MTHGDGDSLSTVYARDARTHTHDTSEMRGASPCVTNGKDVSVNGGYLPENAHFSSRASQANGSHTLNGGSKTEGVEQPRGTRTSEPHNRGPISATRAVSNGRRLDDEGCSDYDAVEDNVKPLKVAI